MTSHCSEKIKILRRVYFRLLIDDFTDGLILKIGEFFLDDFDTFLTGIDSFQFVEAVPDLEIAHTLFPQKIIFDQEMENRVRDVRF